MLSIASKIFTFVEAHLVLVSTVGFAAAIIAIIQFFFQGISRVTSWLRNVWRVLNRRPITPSKTVELIPAYRALYWNAGAQFAGKPAMQISSDWHVTNITDRPVRLLSARIVSPRRARAEGMLTIQSPSSKLHGDYPIAPHNTQDMRVFFFVQPPFGKHGQDVKATLVFTDQYNNKHKLKHVVFKSAP